MKPTIESTIEYLKEECNSDYAEVAIDALEKQIPKKPNETDAYPHRLYCPSCYHTFLYNKEDVDMLILIKATNRHCCNCSQAIDWSEEV